MDTRASTRTELLALRARTRLAEQGREVLEGRRRELVAALRRLARDALATRDRLGRAAAAARSELALAEALHGPAALRSAAWAAAGDVQVEATAERIAGVAVPRVERPRVGRARAARGYGLSVTPARVDVVAERFEAVLDLVLDVASSEARLRRLADAAAATSRRANALRHVVVPALRAAARRVSSALAEREREDTFRLRRARERRLQEGAAT